jgi:hypothetical protein
MEDGGQQTPSPSAAPGADSSPKSLLKEPEDGGRKGQGPCPALTRTTSLNPPGGDSHRRCPRLRPPAPGKRTRQGTQGEGVGGAPPPAPRRPPHRRGPCCPPESPGAQPPRRGANGPRSSPERQRWVDRRDEPHREAPRGPAPRTPSPVLARGAPWRPEPPCRRAPHCARTHRLQARGHLPHPRKGLPLPSVILDWEDRMDIGGLPRPWPPPQTLGDKRSGPEGFPSPRLCTGTPVPTLMAHTG